MAGAEGWCDIQTFGEARADELRLYRPLTYCIPRCHTIARILRTIIVSSLLEALLSWVNER
jgi:hypothetical protein